ncbi:SMEK domain-containing protein [Pedobacter sp. JCM 36344]|uniref:SMEK domain-containing protein n=1 Tax=Pedobacter sp. JCM 36344 TaxID=3374280 RepID=UPI00397B7E6E
MDDREVGIKTIVEEFAIWERKLSMLSSVNLHDLHLISEHYSKELLNLIFNHEFISANGIQANHAAVDLVDKKNRTAAQVSSTKTASKIQKTLDAFHQNLLFKDYDRLIVLVLGKKQRTYTNLRIPDGVKFSVKADIIDFDDLVKTINVLSTQSILKICAIFKDNKGHHTTTESKSVLDIQKSMELKSRLKKDIQLELPREQWTHSHYEPWIKFVYHNFILRDPDDTLFPEVDPENCTWLKVESWNFYDRGLEFMSHGGDAVFDELGYWDILEYNDPRKDNPKYEVRPYNVFTRLEYLNIATYDLESDPYYSSPTIYCTFFPDREHPFSEILYGHAGSVKEERWTYIFDNAMRRKSGWEVKPNP